MKTYKGTDENLKCKNDYQYEVGKDFECEGKIECCGNGLHSCENPLDVFNYYTPSNSRYFECEADGDIDKADDNSKVASRKLHISAEIGLHGLISAGVKFILDKVDYSAATNTGNQSAATNTGDRSASKVTGKESVAIVTGNGGKAYGSKGCWIVFTERGEWDGTVYPIKEVRAVKVDGKEIKENVYYQLIDGKVIEYNN